MKLLIALLTTLMILTAGVYPSTENYTAQTEKGEFTRAAMGKNSDEYHNGEVSDYVWSETEEYTEDYAVTLTKEEGKEFVILNIADIHFSDTGYRVFYSISAEATLKNLVADVNPDLILLSGDNVCGDAVEYSIRRLTDLMESFGIPWAPIFGNHDDEANCDLSYLADIMMKGPHCLMKKGDIRMGVGNYVINIKEGDSIVETLVMMDSHHGSVNELQQQWYSWVCRGTDAVSGGNAEVSLVEHIPIAEYQYAADEYYSNRSWAAESAGTGEINEKICCPRDGEGQPIQTGFFDVIKASGNTGYVFCGHEHMNDFSVEYDGIRLTYFMKIGKNSGYQPGFDGGSVVTVGSDGLTSITHKVKSAGGFKDIERINLVTGEIASSKAYC